MQKTGDPGAVDNRFFESLKGNSGAVHKRPWSTQKSMRSTEALELFAGGPGADHRIPV